MRAGSIRMLRRHPLVVVEIDLEEFRHDVLCLLRHLADPRMAIEMLSQELLERRLLARIAIAETYDVIVTIPDNLAYELRATSEDGTGYSSTILGKGTLVTANTIPRPNLFIMHHGTQSMYGTPIKTQSNMMIKPHDDEAP